MGPPVAAHVLAEVALGLAVGRAIVVGQVKMRDSMVKRRAKQRLLVPQGGDVPEVVPQAQGDQGELQAAKTAAPIGHAFIARRVGLIHPGRLL